MPLIILAPGAAVGQRVGRWKYVYCEGDPDLLFDLQQDSQEQRNLCTDPASASKAASTAQGFVEQIDQRYKPAQIRQRVLASQRRRHRHSRRARPGASPNTGRLKASPCLANAGVSANTMPSVERSSPILPLLLQALALHHARIDNPARRAHVMNLRQAMVRSALALTVMAGMASTALAQTKPAAPDGVTIVIPLAAAAGKSRSDAVQAMRNIVAGIRKQPGLIDEVLMEDKNPANKPTHGHVTRWRELKNWGAVFANPEFQQAMNANTAFFTVDGAGIYTAVK